MNNRRNSGQVILIAILATALILLSTQVYVFEVNMSTANVVSANYLNDYVYAMKLGSRNTVIGSLANISNGGSASALTSNLDRWVAVVEGQIQSGRSILDYTLEDTTPYSSGIWLSWGTNGLGVSSAYARFAFNLSDQGTDADLSYSINVTSTLMVEGTFTIILGDEKQVNITFNLYNEGVSALAAEITVYYRVGVTWMTPNASNSYVLTDYGNGTYLASFNANIPSSTVEVSAQTIDQRGIFVQANATCSQV